MTWGDPPFYPTWLVRSTGGSRKKLGTASFRAMGWTFRFDEGSLTVSEPTGTYVVNLGEGATEEFVRFVNGVDAGRYTSSTWELVEKK